MSERPRRRIAGIAGSAGGPLSCAYGWLRHCVTRSLFSELLAAFLVVIVTPTILISSVSFRKIVRDVEISYVRERLDVLRSIHQYIVVSFEDLQRLTLNVLLSDVVHEILASDNQAAAVQVKNQWKFMDLAVSLLGNRPDIAGAYLVCPNGYVYDRSLSGTLPGYDFSSEPWFRKIRDSKGEFVLNGSHAINYTVVHADEYELTAGRSVRDLNTGRAQGTFFLSIKKDVFTRLFSGKASLDSHLVVVERDGMIVFDTDARRIMSSFARAYPGLSLTPGISWWKGKEGQKSMVAVQDSAFGWSLVDITPQDRLYRRIREISLPIIGVAILLSAVFMLIGYVLSRSIVGPLRRLEEAMESTEEGHLASKVVVGGSGDMVRLSQSFNAMTERIHHLVSEVHAADIRQMDTQLSALQAQVTPHFLYNTLESINCLAQIENAPATAEMIRGLAKLFRYNSQPFNAAATLGDELDHVRNYATLQGIRYENLYSIDYAVDASLLGCELVRLTLQPIVENAIVHGLKDRTEGGVIRITARRVGDTLEVSVTDNGTGIDAAVLKGLEADFGADAAGAPAGRTGRHSIGLVNIHQRIRLRFGSPHGLTVHSVPREGAVVRMTLPFHVMSGAADA